jgi:hypothetical protein
MNCKNEEKLYSQRHCKCIINFKNIVGKNGKQVNDIGVDWINGINVQSYGKEDLIIFYTDMMIDELYDVLSADISINGVKADVNGECSCYSKDYGRMKLQLLITDGIDVKSIVVRYYICLTNSDVKDSVLKKEINNILDRQERYESSGRLSRDLNSLIRERVVSKLKDKLNK